MHSVVFFGTSSFAVPALRALHAAKYNVEKVITAPSKPAGRKKTLAPSPIKLVADELHIPTLEPEKLTSDIIPSADIYVIASYGKFLPNSILSLPRYGALNIHPSLLPKYRGPSPIQSAILENEKETGVTIMLTDKEMDHGPILSQKKVTINENDTSETLTATLADIGATLLLETIPDWISGKITAKAQNHELATFTKIIAKEDGRIDWSQPADIILRKIRAYTPWPGSWTELSVNDKPLRIKILKAHKENKKREQVKPGTFMSDTKKLLITTKDYWLIIDELQPESRMAMPAAEFLRGYSFKSLQNSPES